MCVRIIYVKNQGKQIFLLIIRYILLVPKCDFTTEKSYCQFLYISGPSKVKSFVFRNSYQNLLLLFEVSNSRKNSTTEKECYCYFFDTTDNPTYFKFWTWREKFCSFVVMNLSTTAYINWYYIRIFRMLFLSLLTSQMSVIFGKASFFLQWQMSRKTIIIIIRLQKFTIIKRRMTTLRRSGTSSWRRSFLCFSNAIYEPGINIFLLHSNSCWASFKKRGNAHLLFFFLLYLFHCILGS